ncbi:3432_t:CDS:2, partial [Acaulospora morrowiae]
YNGISLYPQPGDGFGTHGFNTAISKILHGKNKSLRKGIFSLIVSDTYDTSQSVRSILLEPIYAENEIIATSWTLYGAPKGSYIIVLEYAELGDLREYLKEKFAEITWKEKIDISRQHTRNIVLSKRDEKIRAIITDFGMSKVLSRGSLTFSILKGVPAFVDPTVLNEENYDNFTKKSDVYSLGVVLWEISSGTPPFEGQINILAILGGKRETPVPGTPCEYIEIYRKCWDEDPKRRPSVHYVFERLGEEIMVTGPVFKGPEKCCENHPHHELTSKRLETRISETDSMSSNVSELRLIELFKDIDKLCSNQSYSKVIRTFKQNAPNLAAKLMEYKDNSTE